MASKPSVPGDRLELVGSKIKLWKVHNVDACPMYQLLCSVDLSEETISWTMPILPHHSQHLKDQFHLLKVPAVFANVLRLLRGAGNWDLNYISAPQLLGLKGAPVSARMDWDCPLSWIWPQ